MRRKWYLVSAVLFSFACLHSVSDLRAEPPTGSESVPPAASGSHSNGAAKDVRPDVKYPKEWRHGENWPPPRGSLGAEIGGGIAGLFGGFLAIGVPTWAVTAIVYRNDSDTGLLSLGLGGFGGVVGAAVGPGVGASIAGDATGGTGHLGFAIFGSSLSGIVGALLPVAVGGLAKVLQPGIKSDDLFTHIQSVGGLVLGPSAAVTGGVLGYRWSARRRPEKKVSLHWMFELRPNRAGATTGIGVRF